MDYLYDTGTCKKPVLSTVLRVGWLGRSGELGGMITCVGLQPAQRVRAMEYMGCGGGSITKQLKPSTIWATGSTGQTILLPDNCKRFREGREKMKHFLCGLRSQR